MINCRKEVVKLLNKTFSENSYSNILLDSVLSGSDLSSQDRRFITNLYYGVIERRITLDYIIGAYSTKGIKKLDETVLNILRMGIYQLKYMDSVPDSAAVNESVRLVKSMKVSSASGFVNAVLRNFIRDEKKIKFPSDKIKRMSVEYSVSADIIRMLISDYGRDFTLKFLKRLNGKSPVYIRKNNIKTDKIVSVGKAEITENDFLPCCYEVGSGNLTDSAEFKNGLFHVQDISSQLACLALNPKENETVLDLCSAPGGKAFTIAELMNGTGRVFAFDIHEHRVKLIQDGAERLGLSNIEAKTGDALVHIEEYEGVDKVLCDVPCSGIGVMRKKPEIRYKNPSEFAELSELQYCILQNAASYLRKGGELVYSTCTLSKKENDDVIEKFLSENSEYERVPFFEDKGKPFGEYKAVLGADGPDSDGFFIAKIKRKD